MLSKLVYTVLGKKPHGRFIRTDVAAFSPRMPSADPATLDLGRVRMGAAMRKHLD